MARRKRKTAQQLIAELEADPEWVRGRELRDRAHRERVDELRRAERPIVEDLRRCGAAVDSVGDLVQEEAPYAALLPVLLAHLDKPYPHPVRESIARALAVPEARSFWDQLVVRFESEPEAAVSQVKWALHLAIAAAADVSVLPALIRLAVDRKHGRNRAMFALALGNMAFGKLRDPLARAALNELRGDPDIGVDVRKVMRGKSIVS